MATKIGFNNFKAFGSKMQYFTKKPITLIYGPNSVGKSSLLHSQIISNYYFENQNDHYNFNNISYAGDELDLGGYTNFIHKHEKSKEIAYEYILNHKKDILYVFNLSSLINIEILEKYFNTQYINEKLESKYINTNIKFKYLFEYKILLTKFNIKLHINQIIKDDEIKFEKEKLDVALDKITMTAVCEYYNKSFDDLTEIELNNFNTEFKKIKNYIDGTTDPFEVLLLETLHINTLDIIERLKFFKIIKGISEIKLVNYLSANGFSRSLFFIDSSLLFEENIKGLEFNIENYYLKQYNKVANKLRLYSIDIYTFKEYNDLHFCIALMISTTTLGKKQNQYFGPLRHYPKRFELYNIENLNNTTDSLLKKLSILFTKNRKNLFIGIFLFGIPTLYYNTFIRTKSFFETDYVGLILPILMLFLLIIGIYNQLSKSNFGREKLNTLLPKRFGLLRDKVMSSYDSWKIIATNNEILSKLNNWLGDKDKLKSNYSIKVNRKPITYLGIFERFLLKLLGLEHKSNLYKLNIKKTKSESKIIKLCSYIERKLNIKQRYESQVVFTDISTKTDVTPRDMGLGISQVLPILISCFNSKNTMNFLEQPELHLHPAIQMELMDEIIKSKNKNSNEFMLESHSEHMLLRVMKRIRQTNDGTLEDESLRLTPDDVSLLYVDNDGEQTYLQELRLSKKGKLLDHWPNGFFEDGYKERFS